MHSIGKPTSEVTSRALPDTFDRDSLLMRVIVSLSCFGAVVPVLGYLCLLPFAGLPSVRGIVMSAFLAMPMLLLTMMAAFGASILVAAILHTLGTELSPTSFGATVGATTSLFFSFPFFVVAEEIHFRILAPTAIGLYFQLGGIVGSNQFQLEHPNAARNHHSLAHFGIRQLMMVTAWFAVTAAVISMLRLPNAIGSLSSLTVWAILQMLFYWFLLKSMNSFIRKRIASSDAEQSVGHGAADDADSNG